MNDPDPDRRRFAFGAFSGLFAIAALYDGGVGIAFLFAGDSIFRWLEVVPPNHPGYVQFPAALLIVFAAMFAVIAGNPHRNRNLIPYGILLKVSYCGVVGYHWLVRDVPSMWKPFFVFDLVFIGLFLRAFMSLRRRH